MGSETSTPTFTPRKTDDSSRSLLPWLVASGVILLLLAIAILTFHRKTAASGVLFRIDPYAENLKFSDIQMSESASLSGAKVTYIDGHVTNAGPQTVTGAELQVLFANDVHEPSQVEGLPLMLIRTHEPYTDTEAVSAAPLTPGGQHEFRLAFEDISPNWNQQIPEIHVIAVSVK